MMYEHPKVYAVRHRKESIREQSRSGGVFSALSDYVLEQGGTVYGCVLTDTFEAIHVRADQKEQRDRMRGSKYVQSKIGESYKNVQMDLRAGKKVLFTGTSCQITGLKCFLGKEYDTLFCVDIVCHGVPSPAVWKAYLQWQENQHHSSVSSVDFRNKKDFGWRGHVETLHFSNGKAINSNIFANLFYSHQILRPCCYECPYKSILHPGDITIADYWGIEKAAPELDDNKGVSLVLINSEQGMELFKKIKNVLIFKKTRIEDSMQPPLIGPFPQPKEREQFWLDFKNKNFTYIAKVYGGYQGKIKHTAKAILRAVKRKFWIAHTKRK